MARDVVKNTDDYSFWPNPDDSKWVAQWAMSRVGHLRSYYKSNRENGQVVKRESPWSFSMSQTLRAKRGAQLDMTNSRPQSSFLDNWTVASSIAYGRAYASFRRQAQVPSAEVLLNVVEGKKSLEMIAARAFQLRELLNALRKGKLGNAWLYMTLNPDQSLLGLKNGRRRDSRFVSGKERQASMDGARRLRQLVKDISSVILEFRYGWSPLMQDIKNACEVLSKPIPDKPVKARSTVTWAEKVNSFGYGLDVINFSDVVTIRGRIRVTNPNLDLANRLGLINPASVAWEAVPFSFVVDWFLPIGDFLRSFTDFVGIELIDGSITGTRTWYGQNMTHLTNTFNGATVTGQFKDPTRVSGRGKRIIRTVGISSLPRPPLGLGSGLSPGRALNAVALLLQSVNPRAAARVRGESRS